MCSLFETSVAGVLDQTIYNSNQLCDEALGTTWEEEKEEGPAVSNIQGENGDGGRTRAKKKVSHTNPIYYLQY